MSITDPCRRMPEKFSIILKLRARSSTRALIRAIIALSMSCSSKIAYIQVNPGQNRSRFCFFALFGCFPGTHIHPLAGEGKKEQREALGILLSLELHARVSFIDSLFEPVAKSFISPPPGIIRRREVISASQAAFGRIRLHLSSLLFKMLIASCSRIMNSIIQRM